MGAVRLVASLCLLGAALGTTLTDSEAAQEPGLLKWERKEQPELGTSFENIELNSEVKTEESATTGLLEEPEQRRPRPRARNGKRRRRMRRPRTKRLRTTPSSKDGDPELDLAEGRLANSQYEKRSHQEEDRPRFDQDEDVVYQRRRPAKRRRRPQRKPHEFTDPSRLEDIPAMREAIHGMTLETEHETPSENQFEQRLSLQKDTEIETVTQNEEAKTTTVTQASPPRRRRKGGRKRIRIDGEWKAVEMSDSRLDDQSNHTVKQELSTISQLSPQTKPMEVLSYETSDLMTTVPNESTQHNTSRSEGYDEPSRLPSNHASELNTFNEGTNSNLLRVKEQVQRTVSGVQIREKYLTSVDESTNNGQNFSPTSGTPTKIQNTSEMSSKEPNEATTQAQRKLYDTTIQTPSEENYHKLEPTKITREETTFRTSTNVDGSGKHDSNSSNGYTQTNELAVSAPVPDKPSGSKTHYSLFPSFSVREVTQLSDYKIKNQDSDDYHPGSTINDDNTIQGHKNSYSATHRLPTTAAVIRRQLQPKLQLIATSERDDMILPMKHLINKKKQITSINTRKNDAAHRLLMPTGFPEQPEIISPSKIIEEAKMEEMLKLEIERIAKKDNKTQLYNTPLGRDSLKFEALGIPNVNDDILDLLKTETGSELLARILEIRNMTLTELIKHRERGSSQLHLMEIFDKNTAGQPRETLNDNLKLAGDERNSTPDSEPTNPSITQFPDEELVQIPTLKTNQQKQTQRTSISSSTSTPISISSTPMSNDKREPRVFDSMPQFPAKLEPRIPQIRHQMYDNRLLYAGVPFRGISKELPLTTTSSSTASPKRFYDINDVVLLEGYDETNLRNNLKGGKMSTESSRVKDFRALPTGVKSAIIASGAILSLAIIGFFALLVSCRIRQRRTRIRIKRDILCDHPHYEDFRSSQRSLTPVLRKSSHHFGPGIHSNTASNRHYYLWRTLRKTFQYD